MKSYLTLILAALLALSTVGCAAKTTTPETTQTAAPETTEIQATEEEPMEGGWTNAEDPEITPELRKLCEKAMDGLEGAVHTPVALLATQVVAGTNYRILFRTTIVVPDAVETYSIGTLYEDLEGNVTLTDLESTSAETDLTEDLGGWTQPESVVLPQEAKEAFDTAMDGLVGVDYQPLALVASQVVAGTNYRILCQATVVYPDAEPYYAMVTVSSPLEGRAEVLEITNLE